MDMPIEFETVIGYIYCFRDRLYNGEYRKLGYDTSYIAKFVLDTFIFANKSDVIYQLTANIFVRLHGTENNFRYETAHTDHAD